MIEQHQLIATPLAQVQATPVEQLEVTAREDVQVTPRELVTAAVIHVRQLLREVANQ